MPETTPGRPGALASLRPRVAVPRQARGTFAMALPCLIAVWMISGFYLSLGPSLAAQVLRSPDLLWGGLVIFLLERGRGRGHGRARRASGPAAMLAGCLALLAGTAVTLAAIETASAPALLAGTAVAGAGFGTAMLGAFRTISTLAAPGQRAGLIAAYFIVVLHGVQYPRRDRRGGHHAFRPAPDRPGLLRGDRRARRVAAAGIFLLPAGARPERRRQGEMRMTTSAPVPVITLNDHGAAAAYLMEHAAPWPTSPRAPAGSWASVA